MTRLKPGTLRGWNQALIVEQPEGPQRALVAGTGLDVFEIFSVYRSANEDWDDLREWFEWLSEEQLCAALGYCGKHLPALEARWAEEADVKGLLEQLWRDHPQTRPPR